VAVAGTQRRRRRRRGAGAEERRGHADDDDRRDRRRDERSALHEPRHGAQARARPLLLLVGTVDQPQHRADALVDQVHAHRREHELHDGVVLDQHDQAEQHQDDAAQRAQRGALRLGRHPGERPAQRLAEVDRPDERGRRGGDHGARAGDDPSERAQVAEVGVPDGAGGCAVLGTLDVMDRDRAHDAVGDDDHDPGGRGRDPELDDRVAPAR
jgi:hypothetical protein